MTFDLIIQNGTIVDGTGASGYRGDIGIAGDRIHAIGDLSRAGARDLIDASGLVVAPGFVDVHNHAHNEMEGGILNIPDVENLLRQGITTLIAGNCGSSPWPIAENLEAAEALPIRQNYGLLAGLNKIRQQAGVGSAPATTTQIVRMQQLASQAMDEGAFGLSTGYFPDFVSTDEIAAAARPIAEAGGVYATHLRSESAGLLDSVEEAIRICEKSGCPGQLSHIKCWGNQAWKWADQVLEMIDKARQRGVDLTADRYPYVASFTTVRKVVPIKLRIEARRRGGMECLRDEDLIGPVREGIKDCIDQLDGAENLVFAPLDPMPEIDGKSLEQAAGERGEEPWETALEMTIRGNVSTMFFAMREENMRTFMLHPAVFPASDGHLRVLGKGVSHPRNYGTFPRWVGRYGRDEGFFTVEDVVRKCSCMPASKFGLHERGTLAPRKIADIVLFDWERIIDTATFDEPHQYPEGIPHVLVGGKVAMRDGYVMEKAWGKALRLNT